MYSQRRFVKYCGRLVSPANVGRIILLLLATACSTGEVRMPSSDETKTKSSSAVRDTQPHVSQSGRAPLTILIDSLSRLEGDFARAPQGLWKFTGDRSVFHSIYEHGDSAVVQLVNCLDSSHPKTGVFGWRIVQVEGTERFVMASVPPSATAGPLRSRHLLGCGPRTDTLHLRDGVPACPSPLLRRERSSPA